MKKLNYLLAGFILVALLGSCEKNTKDTNLTGTYIQGNASALIIPGPSTPVSLGPDGERDLVGDQTPDDVTPQIIAGANKGGNRTCAEVEAAFSTTANPVHFDVCGDKHDYGDFDGDGDYEFDGAFLTGLNVTVSDGKFVSFTMNNFGLNCYRVGAVIVKGSNSANVYFYPGGTLGDNGLAAPLNASGSPAGLSNLTFCFFKCEQNDLVIAIKSFVKDGPVNYIYGFGTQVFYTTEWCEELDINPYPGTSSIDMMFGGTKYGVATVTGGVVTVTLNDGLTLDRTHVYVGTLDALLAQAVSQGGCPNYYDGTLWKWNEADGNSQSITIP